MTMPSGVVGSGAGLGSGVAGCAGVETAGGVGGVQNGVDCGGDGGEAFGAERPYAEVGSVGWQVAVAGLLEDVQRAQVEVAADGGDLVAVVATPGEFCQVYHVV